jgi:uncharacterized membrane protein
MKLFYDGLSGILCLVFGKLNICGFLLVEHVGFWGWFGLREELYFLGLDVMSIFLFWTGSIIYLYTIIA